jgi:hypothetical protein
VQLSATGDGPKAIVTLRKPPPDIVRLSAASLVGKAEIDRLRNLLQSEPDARDARLTLMAARRAPPAVRAAQVFWFVEHEPTTFFGHHAWMAVASEGTTPGEYYDDAKRRWLLAVDSHRDDLRVAENAAWFMMNLEPHRGAELLDGRSRRESDPAWSRCALSYLEAASESNPDEALSFAARALEAGYRVFRLAKGIEDCVDLLPTLRGCAARGAIDSAAKALELAEAAGVEWHHADRSSRPQLAHTIFGLVALAEGDTTRAEQHFRRAGTSTVMPSEALVSFAAELLALGATETVAETLDQWASRFEECASAAKEWASAIRAGRNIAPPTFPPKRGV